MQNPREIDWRSLNGLVAENTRRLRRAKGWTQRDLAERLSQVSEAAWTVSKVSDLERAGVPSGPSARSKRERHTTVNELGILAYALEVPVFDLLLPHGDEGLRLGPRAYYASRTGASLVLFHWPARYLSKEAIKATEDRYSDFLGMNETLREALHESEAEDWPSAFDEDELKRLLDFVGDRAVIDEWWRAIPREVIDKWRRGNAQVRAAKEAMDRHLAEENHEANEEEA